MTSLQISSTSGFSPCTFVIFPVAHFLSKSPSSRWTRSQWSSFSLTQSWMLTLTTWTVCCRTSPLLNISNRYRKHQLAVFIHFSYLGYANKKNFSRVRSTVVPAQSWSRQGHWESSQAVGEPIGVLISSSWKDPISWLESHRNRTRHPQNKKCRRMSSEKWKKSVNYPPSVYALSSFPQAKSSIFQANREQNLVNPIHSFCILLCG